MRLKATNPHEPLSKQVAVSGTAQSQDTILATIPFSLMDTLKARLDQGKLGFIPSVTLSFLKEEEQVLLDKCMDLNGFKVDIKKDDILRQYSEKGNSAKTPYT